MRPQSLSTGRVVPDRLLDTHLARVLFSAQRRRRTGVLTVDEGSHQTHLHLVDGRIVFAEAGAVAETLGRLLMRTEKIDREEYLVILDHMSRPSEEDAILRFGEVAITLGMLSPAELNEALAMQVRQKLQRVLTLDECVWLWVDDESPRTSTPYPTPLEPVLLAALREDPEGYRYPGLLAARRQRIVTLVREPDDIARRFEASPAELRFLTKVNGRPLADLLASRILEPAQTGALLCALIMAEEIELGQGEKPAPVAQVVHTDLAPPAVLYVAPLERHEPEPSAREVAARLMTQVRRHPQRAPIDSERELEKGKKLLAQGHVERAREAFERADKLLPHAADTTLYLRWCTYLATEDPIAKKKAEGAVRTAIVAALKQDRAMAFAHYAQGRLSLIDGDERAAERAFAIAVACDASDLDAQRYLRLLRLRRG